ncbi:MAG TPA: hypothetical protein VGG19_02390 [Tepidisphaeraceae bacterium]|jgi:hypothetical protein
MKIGQNNMVRFLVQYLFLFCVILMVCSADTLAAIQPPTVHDLIERYNSSISPFLHVSYTAKVRLNDTVNGQKIDFRQQNPQLVDKYGVTTIKVFYRCDVNRLDFIDVRPTTSQVPLDPADDLWRNIILGDKWLRLVQSIGDKKGSVDQQSAKINKMTPAELLANARSLALVGGEALDGWIRGRRDKNLPEIFATASDTHLHPDSQLIDGHATWVISCTDAGESFTAWLDLQQGCQPRRIEVRRLGHEKGFDLTVANVKFETVEGLPVAEAAQITQHFYHDDKDYGKINDFTRFAITFHPDFAKMGAFVMVAPPDYAVMDVDLPNTRWKLENGKFVPVVDQAVVSSVDQLAAEENAIANEPAPPVAAAAENWQTWLLWTIAVCACTGAFVSLRAFMRRHRHQGRVN